MRQPQNPTCPACADARRRAAFFGETPAGIPGPILNGHETVSNRSGFPPLCSQQAWEAM